MRSASEACPRALAWPILFAVPHRPSTSLPLALGLLVIAAPLSAMAGADAPAPAPVAAPAADAPPTSAADDAADPAAPPAPASVADEAPAAPPTAPANEADEAADETPPAPANEEPPATNALLVLPPRVDGPYVGGMIYAPGAFVRVRDLETPGVFPGVGGSLRAGEAVLRWLTIGVEITGTLAYQGDQRLGQGALIVDFGFLPLPRLPLSLHAGFGVGGGAVRQQGIAGRSGFGGAVFKGAVRYDFFPFAAKKRPRRGGGFGLGPELGWIGFTPAAAGRPMSNTVYLGLGMGFFFGS